MPTITGVLVAACVVVSGVHAATYSLAESSVGSSFYTNYAFDAIADPTHGRVVYVDESTARARNLTYASSDTFILRTDSTTVLSASGAGRNSVRLKSRRTWNSHVTVIDLRHMPQGCGTWPAIWELGYPDTNWPYLGEVDIIEGVNDQGENQAALHTDAGCTMSNLQQTGQLTYPDCDAFVNGNSGCSVRFPGPNSYGPAFNGAGGGYFAMERTTTAVRIWFWPRNGGGAPAGVVNGSSSITTDGWGTPIANYNNAQCDINAKFKAANIIINLTLCGDWAGSPAVWAQSACAAQGDCVSYVNNNPSGFTNAYFDFKAVRVYT